MLGPAARGQFRSTKSGARTVALLFSSCETSPGLSSRRVCTLREHAQEKRSTQCGTVRNLKRQTTSITVTALQRIHSSPRVNVNAFAKRKSARDHFFCRNSFQSFSRAQTERMDRTQRYRFHSSTRVVSLPTAHKKSLAEPDSTGFKRKSA